jgi:Ser/Thr protein kinase RdoA (MazF antagonist)
LIVPFQKATYLTQVRRLRSVAEAVLRRYPIKIQSIEFIHHGENTTFKVTARPAPIDARSTFRATPTSETFLFRIHRLGYHSFDGICEELQWLERLAKNTQVGGGGVSLDGDVIHAPRPVRSLGGRLIESFSADWLDGERHCDLFRWVEGRFIFKNTTVEHCSRLGELLARLHENTRGVKSTRRYWDADGLIGPNPKMGATSQLTGATKREQDLVTRASRELHRELRSFEKKHPERFGLIHSDLHFGNFVVRPNGEISPIDFDDSGWGFIAYDFCAPLLSLQYLNELKPDFDYELHRNALFDGYLSLGHLDGDDFALMDTLMLVRKVSMLGWLNSRSDNPRLKAILPKRIKHTIPYLVKYLR